MRAMSFRCRAYDEIRVLNCTCTDTYGYLSAPTVGYPGQSPDAFPP